MALSAEDKIEILELIARYNHTIDAGDTGGWAATFTENGIFEAPDTTAQGPEDLKRFVAKIPAGGRHWVNNVMIDGSGNSATASCYLHVLNVKEGGKTIVTGLYNDTLERVGGAWKIAHRKVTLDG